MYACMRATQSIPRSSSLIHSNPKTPLSGIRLDLGGDLGLGVGDLDA